MTTEHTASTEADVNGRKPRPTARPRQARLKPYAIVNALLADGWRFATSGGELFTYTQGTYIPGEGVLREHLFERLGSHWEPARVSAVIQGLKDISPKLWDIPSQTHINLINGLYNRETSQLEPHTPEYLSPVQLPINYDRTASCLRVDDFLKEIFPKNSGPLPYEILGYLCTTDTWLKRAFFLQGPTHSGKSTFTKLVRRFLGDRNVTEFSLQYLSHNHFGLAELQGKLANAFPDLPATRIEDSSVFKRVTGDDQWDRGEHKYERPFRFYVYCRLLFSANEFPQTADQSEAYLNRWLVLLFENQFELNRHFLENLITPEELSGLFNQAMDAYQDVLDRGDFTSNEATQQGSERLREAIVPVIAFINEACDTSSERFHADRVELYQAFCGWCSQTGRRRPSNRRFYEQLRQHFPQGAELKLHGNWVWSHLTLNDTGTQALDYFHRRDKM